MIKIGARGGPNGAQVVQDIAFCGLEILPYQAEGLSPLSPRLRSIIGEPKVTTKRESSRTNERCRRSMEEHGRRRKPLEVRRRQRYCASGRVSRTLLSTMSESDVTSRSPVRTKLPLSARTSALGRPSQHSLFLCRNQQKGDLDLESPLLLQNHRCSASNDKRAGNARAYVRALR
jgi:hypothetical protein